MADPSSKEICGLVMPISAIDGLPESHWAEVLSLISEAIEKAGVTPNLVSNADDVGIIQKRIIQNLYDNPIVMCDVSSKNPNVMFELGMRLAFDKPTIIVKDDKTTYSFDTSPIEHLSYPRDLRYVQIVEFKEKLADKIKGTHSKASSDASYTTFLKNFGESTIAKLDKKEVSGQEFILEELRAMRASIQRLERTSEGVSLRRRSRIVDTILSNPYPAIEPKLTKLFRTTPFIGHYSLRNLDDRTRVYVEIEDSAPEEFIRYLTLEIERISKETE